MISPLASVVEQVSPVSILSWLFSKVGLALLSEALVLDSPLLIRQGSLGEVGRITSDISQTRVQGREGDGNSNVQRSPLTRRIGIFTYEALQRFTVKDNIDLSMVTWVRFFRLVYGLCDGGP